MGFWHNEGRRERGQLAVVDACCLVVCEVTNQRKGAHGKAQKWREMKKTSSGRLQCGLHFQSILQPQGWGSLPRGTSGVPSDSRTQRTRGA